MKKILSTIAIAVCLSLSGPIHSHAYTVYCTNCSNMFMQALDRVTNVSQLSEQVSQTEQQIQQTVQQITMVKQGIQNLMALPDTVKSKSSQLVSKYTQLAQLTSSLNTYRGESNALAQVFNELFPAQSTFANLSSSSSSADIAAANAKYQAFYDNWSKSIDQSCQSTFQLSGSQLKDLSDSGDLQSHIQDLLSTPEGQLQAQQAGNELAALQIQEARQFRELMATKVQQDTVSTMKQDKYDEYMTEKSKKAFETNSNLQQTDSLYNTF